MDPRKKSSKEESREIEKRRYDCVLKFEKIVEQFDDLADALDPITQLAKRSKTSKCQDKKKNPSGAGGSNSAAGEDEATQRSALEQIISKHLIDLQSNKPPGSSSSPKDP